VRELRRGLLLNVEGRKARAGQLEKLLEQVMASYKEPDETQEAAPADFGASSAVAHLQQSATAALQKLFADTAIKPGKDKAKDKKVARDAINSLISTAVQQPAAAASGAGAAAAAGSRLQRAALRSVVSTALIFLNAIQQHDPHVLQQVLQLTKDGECACWQKNSLYGLL
jgi:hypothetical protein